MYGVCTVVPCSEDEDDRKRCVKIPNMTCKRGVDGCMMPCTRAAKQSLQQVAPFNACRMHHLHTPPTLPLPSPPPASGRHPIPVPTAPPPCGGASSSQAPTIYGARMVQNRGVCARCVGVDAALYPRGRPHMCLGSRSGRPTGATWHGFCSLRLLPRPLGPCVLKPSL